MSPLFDARVIVNTAMGSRRWQYDLEMGKNSNLKEIKDTITDAVRRVRGVLSNPAPEVLVVEVGPDKIKIRILWSTHDSHRHQMMGSYDQVLTAADNALTSMRSDEEKRAAA